MAYKDYDQQFERLRKRFLQPDLTSKNNIKAIEQHLAFLQAKGAHTRTIIKHLYGLRAYAKALGKDVDMKSADRSEVEHAIAKIEGLKRSPETKRGIQIVIKSFYKHLLGEDLYYPKQVAWIKTTRRMKKMLPEDILSESEVIKMLEAAKNPRDKAIIALLFDSGIRMGELMGLRIKDVELDTEPAHVIVSGKTGMRKIPLMFSVPYLASYLNSNKKRKASEPLWLDIGRWSNLNKVPDYAAIRKRLQEIGRDAGIQKRIYPHLFRHSRATFYANRLTEQQLKAFFGWTGGSTMAATYVHLSGRDIDNSIMNAYGKAVAKEEITPKLKAKICPRCKKENELGAMFCTNCGSSLEIYAAVKKDEATEIAKERIYKALEDPEIMEKVMQELLKRKKK